MAKGTIVKRAKGEEIPDAFLDKVFAELKPNGYAYIVAIDDEVLYDKGFKADLSKNDILNLLKGHEDEMIIFLQHHEGTPPDFESLQPFKLQPTQEVTRADGKKEEQIFFAAVAEGDFSNFHRDKSTNSDEFFMILNVVEPRLDQLVGLTDGDTDKITEQLKKEIIRKEFRETPKGLGAIGIACASGDFIMYGREGQITSFPWGEVSSTFGYTTPKEKPVQPPAEESMAERMKSKIKSKIAPSNQETKTDLKSTTVPVVKQVQLQDVEYTVPKGWGKMSNQDKKRRQNLDLGFQIAGWRRWQEGQVVKVQVARPAEKQQPLKDLSQLDKVVEFRKDTEPHHVQPEQTLPAAASDPKPSEIGVSPLPELKAMREKLMNMDEIKALLNAGASPIMSMSDLDKLKAKTPSFSELSGLDSEQGYQLSGKMLDYLYNEGGQAGWFILKALIRSMQITCLRQVLEQKETGLSETHEPKTSKIKSKIRA